MGLKLVPDNTHIHFSDYRFYAMALSAVLMIGSIFLFFDRGLNYGIDFRGGITIEIAPPNGEEFDTDDLAIARATAEGLDIGHVKVQEIGGLAGEDRGIVIFIEEQEVEAVPGQSDEEAKKAAETKQQEVLVLVKSSLTEALGDVDFRRQDVVGPTVSGELVTKGVQAVVLAVLLMLIYIWFRFEWQFSLGAILALVHDVTLTIGLFALLQLEFTLAIIAALLTIIGYSMNDTVVVFDRVRENLRKFKKMSLKELIDLSVNSTLSRTLMTSLTTLLALAALFFLGGSALRGFTAAMIWGIFVGTYSSIFVASPLLLMTGVKRDWSEQGSDSKEVARP